jgi:hypothetical protein
MGHPSRGTEWYRILGFKLETGTAGRLTIQTVAPNDMGRDRYPSPSGLG